MSNVHPSVGCVYTTTQLLNYSAQHGWGTNDDISNEPPQPGDHQITILPPCPVIVRNKDSIDLTRSWLNCSSTQLMASQLRQASSTNQNSLLCSYNLIRIGFWCSLAPAPAWCVVSQRCQLSLGRGFVKVQSIIEHFWRLSKKTIKIVKSLNKHKTISRSSVQVFFTTAFVLLHFDIICRIGAQQQQ